MPTGHNTARPAAPAGSAPLLVAALAVTLAFAAGCRRDMYDQPKYEAYDASTFPAFKDGSSSRQQVEGTVARDDLQADSLYYTGKLDGKDSDQMPFEVDREVLELGRERYLIYCSPCHGRGGDGRGMVVRRGFSPPPTFHSEYLRKKPVGHIYGVITHGYGAMYSYAARIPVRHRWAITAYIRALQYSREASPADLTGEERDFLAHPEAAKAEKPAAGAAEGHQ